MKKIVIGCYMVGMIQTNFYYLHREGESETIVFDPADHGREINEELTKQGLTVKAIFLTHGHFDHILGVKALREASGAPVYASAYEREFMNDASLNGSSDIRRPCAVRSAATPCLRNLWEERTFRPAICTIWWSLCGANCLRFRTIRSSIPDTADLRPSSTKRNTITLYNTARDRETVPA